MATRAILFTGMLGVVLVGCTDADTESDVSGTGGRSEAGGSAGLGSGGSAGLGTGGSNSGGSAGVGVGGSSTGASAGLGSGGSTSGGSSAGGVGAMGGEPGGAGAASGNGGAATTGGAAGVAGSTNGGMGNAGGNGGAAGAGAGGRGGGSNPGTCTTSKATNTNATGSGPHRVTVETNSDPGINEGTIFRPTDLDGAEKYPIFVWGEGACSKNGLSNATAMAEIASYGYFVVADGTPGGSGNRTMDRSNLPAMAAPLIAYIDWAIAENAKPCSAYYQHLDATKIASNGFSCGGLMSQATVLDPRIVTWGVTSSGMAGANQAFYDAIHTPVLFVEGGPSDIAYDGGLEGYDTISQMDVPVLWFSKDIGHGGDLGAARGGDFTKINLAWLNWWLKGDLTATGKGLLVGAGCTYCTNSAWEVKSAHVP